MTRKKTKSSNSIHNQQLKKRSAAKPKPRLLPSGLEDGIRRIDQLYRDRRARFQQFLKQNRNLGCFERSIAWLHFVAADPENYGDEEAVVYLASQGQDVSSYVDRLIDSWKEDEDSRIRSSIRGVPITDVQRNRTFYTNSLSAKDAADIEHASEYLLPPFWVGHNSQMFTLDATMLRTVEWCEIGGFDPWWRRLARTFEEDMITGGIEPEHAVHYLFNLSRSSYALKLMKRGLTRCLEACELARGGDPPWITYRPEKAKGRTGGPQWLPSEDNLYAAAMIFAAHRVGDTVQTKLIEDAVLMLQRNQRQDGSWSFRQRETSGDVETTAVCIHALASTQPRGWRRQARKSALWLKRQQQEGGYWVNEGSPDPVYLTVIVLDARTLSEGASNVSFRKPEEKLSSSHIPIPKRRFKVAVSFPGEERQFVEKTVRCLQEQIGDESVFYDYDHTAELAAPNLDLRLLQIYRDDADLIVVFVAAKYSEKQWCGLEWRSIREVLKTGRSADIMFLRMKDSNLPPGMLSIDGYLNISELTPSQVADQIAKRVS